jgi:hypothetical protein
VIDHSNEEQQRRRYLVGDLTEEEKRAIEEQYFTDDEAFERLLAAEDDVVDEYVRGSLSPDERQRAAQRLASDPRKTAFARALARWTELSRSDSAKDLRPQPALQFRRSVRTARWVSAIAAVCAILAGAAVLWLSSERSNLRSELARARQEQRGLESRELAMREREKGLQAEAAAERRRNEELSTQLKVEREQRAVAEQLTKVAAVVLLPSLRGSERPNQLVLSSKIERAELQVRLEDPDYRYFRATITGANKEVVWRSGSLDAERVNSHRVLVVTVPARVLRAGDYFLAIEGAEKRASFEEVGEYYFRVVRK